MYTLAAQAGGANWALLIVVYAVSYTHLDVYKRQLRGSIPKKKQWNGIM